MQLKLHTKTVNEVDGQADDARCCTLGFSEVVAGAPVMGLGGSNYLNLSLTRAEAEAYVVGQAYEITIA